MQINDVVPRGLAERRRDTLKRLATDRDVWVSTAHPDHGPHQVPLWFLWDGRAMWMCTGATSVTARNVRAEPRVRLALPDSFDVVLIQGEAETHPAQEVPADAAQAYTETFGWDPRTEDGPFMYVRVVPNTVRAWRGEPELRGRVIMRDGARIGSD
ncbi:pyridoxamine 5'-phosphate oxidase family protein [Streptomyces sp. MMG1121]|uniref:pyridoxamine 5'-phosphate oxidase family protein n=1 Tax=Streptomyces sp. MMG1121 TaxID=1415544 RepID=UPI0006AF9ADB|nr:pyridoxamine 5'-phosphate oxidase family protein [Streptomyces sp. MMG1121]KOV60585.1 pyridoxamine 5'-phosphate oxidase [Streptomyces sp. MMG1121]